MYGPPCPLTWRVAVEPPALSDSAIHLWRLRTGEDGDDPDKGLAWLSPAQQARVAALRDPAVGARYARAQIGLRRVLAAYLDCHPAEIAFGHGPRGKPHLVGPGNQAAGLQFNLTTTGDLALVAVARGAPLGVDCERVRPRESLDAIARRMLPEAVAAALAALPPSARLEQFHLAWTALEADVKADGRGLALRREPLTAPPGIGHCLAAPGHIAAVARIGLAPPPTWTGLELPAVGPGSAL
ncbi:phosphopantetheinyl transferase [Thioflavicoccus mobilis 8321]|uniref:Phosphopantetheinyl transferase n=1 Tax=Thioflavicoccus mobilis 8321 TaxID=765912 RepID=L0GR34_9GAMM|nr:4'-phosphopantetheinyl transferase superfamily protein [Thioflavicoccus mobilis]AGA89208.1 phosphopantetheinyl transferase [Thioflavicoccus mobilis 8321]